jgi:hypothetical protein
MGPDPLRNNPFNTGKMIKLIGKLVICLMTSLSLGCMPMTRNVNFLYQPTGVDLGASGALHICQTVQSASDLKRPVKWIIGEARNNVSQDTGNIVTSQPPAETLLDAFAQEFKRAGYDVVKVDSLPDGVKKGIKITSVSFRLEEDEKIYGVETRCNVKVSFEPWRDGAPVKRVDYESSNVDSTYLDRYNILEKALQNTLQQLTARAVNETAVLLEQK